MSVKISELTTLAPLTTGDMIPYTDAETVATKKITYGGLLDSFIASGTWTPTLTFATAGDLSVAYTIRLGYYIKTRNLVWVAYNILTSTFTHSTASGLAQITGLPYTVANLLSPGPLSFAGVTKANYTNYNSVGITNGTRIELYASGSGQTLSAIASGDMPTGGTVILYGSILYQTT